MKAWQLDKVRRGLLSYRALKAWNRRPRSWERIANDIPFKLAKDDTTPGLRGEVLRRFCANETETLEPVEKLDDVIDFLITQKLLTRTEMMEDWDEFRDAVEVHNRLANLTIGAAEDHMALSPAYVAEGCLASGEKIRLRFRPEPPGTLVWAEEEYSYTPEKPWKGKTRTIREGQEVLNVTRKGYGFSIGELQRFNFFVQGQDRKDVVHYVRVHFSEGPPKDNDIYFLRYGDVPVEAARHQDIDDAFFRTCRNFKIVRFVEAADPAGLAGLMKEE